MPEPRKLRVFLCHASQDKPVVRELYQRLLAEEWIDPWLDEEKLLPGQDWDMEIEKAVEVADAVIVCLSNQSVSKEGYIQRELKFALDIAFEKPEGTIFIIPLRLDECELPRRLRSWQYVDYFPADRRKWASQRLLQSLRIRLDEARPRKEKNEEPPNAPLEAVFVDERIQPRPEERPLRDAPANDTGKVDVGGTIPLIVYFILASFELLGPDSDAMKLPVALAAALAGVFFLMRRQTPKIPAFKISAIIFLVLRGSAFYGDYYGGVMQLGIIPILAGLTSIVLAGILIFTVQSPKKLAAYATMSFAVFLFLIALKLTLGFFGVDASWIHIPITVVSVITAILLWLDL